MERTELGRRIIASDALCEVAERIMRQTLEAFLFEGIIAVEGEGAEKIFYGKTGSGDLVKYSCMAERKKAFGRVKLVRYSIQREGIACTDIYLFLEELVVNSLDGAYTMPFIQELLETLAKDHQWKLVQPERIPEQDRHYEALESHLGEGHPYHPSYKSRIGFTLADNAAYGPEFDRDVAVQWIAVHERLVDVSVSPENEAEAIMRDHLTEEDRSMFREALVEQGLSAESYVLIPVHPWQAEHRLPTLFIEQMANKDIILLGVSRGSYRAQQSIRTLSSRDQSEAAYIKLALSITNTSTSRILAHHTTQNAPLISDWLQKIIQSDVLLTQLKFCILREVMGVSFRYSELPPLVYQAAYGTVGAIYRENVSAYLSPTEEAWPLNAVSFVQMNGEPFIQSAIDRHGIEQWSDALIRTVMLPIIHLLYAHGVALESHAQNIILVLEDELPTRIIVKDLHDGVRYVSDQLLYPEWEPKLNPEPETHRKFNRYSFLQAESVAEVRDYTYDAFFFICMSELGFTLERFGLSEASFWQKCAETIVAYQQEHPEYRERYVLFDLFAEDGLIEEMTKRRLYGDGELYFRKVSNPLQQACEAMKSMEASL